MMSREEVFGNYDVTEAEAERLDAIDQCLLATQAHTNLVARASLPDRWTRHVADSLQLWPLLPPTARSVLDVGSGGGFPALPLAALAQDRRPALSFTLCESIGKKATFLREAIAASKLERVAVVNERAERLTQRFDVVTARAVAALPRLLPLLVPRLSPGGLIVAPKGRSANAELDEARRDWRMTAKRVTSATDPEASILLLSDLERRT